MIYKGFKDKQLSALGFDELIVRGFESYTRFDNEMVSEVNGYVNRLRGAAENMVFSLSFDSLFFKAPSNAPYVEKIYANTEFLSIDMTACSPEDAATLSGEIAGSFSAYHLRPLLSSENAEGVDASLTAASITARQYITAPADDGDNGNED